MEEKKKIKYKRFERLTRLEGCLKGGFSTVYMGDGGPKKKKKATAANNCHGGNCPPHCKQNAKDSISNNCRGMNCGC